MSRPTSRGPLGNDDGCTMAATLVEEGWDGEFGVRVQVVGGLMQKKVSGSPSRWR